MTTARRRRARFGTMPGHDVVSKTPKWCDPGVRFSLAPDEPRNSEGVLRIAVEGHTAEGWYYAGLHKLLEAENELLRFMLEDQSDG